MSEEEPKTAEKKEDHPFTLYDLLELTKEASSDEIVTLLPLRKNNTENSPCSTTLTKTQRTLRLARNSRN